MRIPFLQITEALSDTGPIMERPHRLLPAGTSISLIGCIKTKSPRGVTSTYAHDHGRPNLPKFFFEAVVWRSIGIGESITLSSNLGAMTFPARLDGLLGAGYVVRNYGVSATTLLKNGDFPY